MQAEHHDEYQASSATIERATTDESVHILGFHGSGLGLCGVLVRNVFLTLVTAGIFLPWARTERRRYLWQNTTLGGYALAYHGTGHELFIGYLKAFACYACFILVPMLAGVVFGPAAVIPMQLLMGLVLLALIPFAIWGSRRYLLSRTSWRGIRFQLRGSALPFVKTWASGSLLTLVTLGAYAPVFLNRTRRLMTQATCYGTVSFEYHGEDSQAFAIGVKGFLLSVLTLGLYVPWYIANVQRFQIGNTRFDGARGELSISGFDLLKLLCLQVAGTFLTFGIAFPWITTYCLQYLFARVRFIGPIDFARIQQAPSGGDAAADGLADLLDIGTAL